MTIIVKKEKIKTLIATSDSEFRQRTLAMLNNIAFIGEKLTDTSVVGIKALIERDAEVGNFVVDAACPEGKAILAAIKELWPTLRDRRVFTLIYVDGAAVPVEVAPWAKLPHTKIDKLPLSRDVFMSFFHNRKVQAQPQQQQQAAPQAKPAPTPEKKLSERATLFLEASGHVKETIESINALLANRKDLAALYAIGQRFNGVMGTFAFFSDSKSFGELSKLASIIDDLCRTYEEAEPKAVEMTEPHCKLLLEAAKCSFNILKACREDKDPPADVLAAFQKVVEARESDASISKRASFSQSDIDDLLEGVG